MKTKRTLLVCILVLTPLMFFGQERDEECVEYEPIEMYNLRKSIIDRQKLDTWPSIVEIKDLRELKTERSDSLILYLAETDHGDKLRITNTFDLSKFAETEYENDCKQEGTILTDLRLGSIDLIKMKAEIYCRQSPYAVLVIKN